MYPDHLALQVRKDISREINYHAEWVIDDLKLFAKVEPVNRESFCARLFTILSFAAKRGLEQSDVPRSAIMQEAENLKTVCILDASSKLSKFPIPVADIEAEIHKLMVKLLNGQLDKQGFAKSAWLLLIGDSNLLPIRELSDLAAARVGSAFYKVEKYSETAYLWLMRPELH